MAAATGAIARRRHLRIERLEERALLSGVSYTLTTNQSTYQAGQPIQITLTGTNTTNQTIQTIAGPDLDNFVVTENGVAIWDSELVELPLAYLATLQPGQSLTETATWDGVPNLGRSSGLAGGSFTVTNAALSSPLSASFQIDTPLSYNIMTDESNYAIGQPIEITYTETNTTSEPMSLNTAPSDFSITQAGFGTLLANVPATWGVTSDTATLLPGQSISETATWNGVANVGSLAGTNVWNSVIISNPTAPAGLSAIVTIANPLVSGLTATSPSFANGQPVTLTYTATNTSNVPVTVLDSPGTFSIQDEQPIEYTTVFSQTGTSGSLVTLQPGQSLTQTATWTPAGGQAPVGSYLAYFSGPWNGTGTPFQVGSPGSISTSFTTDKADYAVGEPIQITLTETNTSTTPVTVNSGSSAFQITEDKFSLVANVSSSGGTSSSTETLQPGQSFTQTATWNGVANIGTAPGTTPSGTFVVTSQNAPLGTAAVFEINSPNDPPGSPSSTAVVASLATAKQTVPPGQSTAFTLTLTNQSKKRVKVTPANSANEIAIYRGSQLMWQSRKLTFKGNHTIAADRSIKLRGIFSDKTPALYKSATRAGELYTRSFLRRLHGVEDDSDRVDRAAPPRPRRAASVAMAKSPRLWPNADVRATTSVTCPALACFDLWALTQP